MVLRLYVAPQRVRRVTTSSVIDYLPFTNGYAEWLNEKRYGLDTYFGRKMFYKTATSSRIVVTIPFLSDDQDNLKDADIAPYPQIPPSCALLDKLVSSRFPNALSPIVSAHAQAAIPLNLGAKVPQQLAQVLMRDE